MVPYIPDSWVILKINNSEGTLYKVLAGWSGGYLQGDSWRLNSGITKIEFIDDYYYFSGYSGSVYECHKNSETMRRPQAGVYNSLKDQYGDIVKIINVKDIESIEIECK